MLEVDAIDLRYGAAQALRAISLVAEPGKVTCVLGRNGVGKTSLLRALVGQHPVSRGSIRWEGADITRTAPYERARRGIGYVPQGREIFPLLTVEENLETGFAPLKREDRQIPDDVFALFPVLGDMLRRRGGDLSGGQQQQLAIGRALVMRPRLLLLDEPTEGIQPSIIKDIGRAIAYLRNCLLNPAIVHGVDHRFVILIAGTRGEYDDFGIAYCLGQFPLRDGRDISSECPGSHLLKLFDLLQMAIHA
jgi:urea transport system ATP-binding protein